MTGNQVPVVQRAHSTIHWINHQSLVNIINNYWARLSKISWFVSGDQINYLLKPFFWSTKYVKSLSACSGNRSAIFTQVRSFNYAWAEYYLQQNTYGVCSYDVTAAMLKGWNILLGIELYFYANPPFVSLCKYDFWSHERTHSVCKELLAGHVVRSRPMKRKAKIHRMILDVVSNYPVDSNLCAGEHLSKVWTSEGWSNMSNTRKSVSSDIQTLKSGLKNEVQAEFFLTNFEVFWYLMKHSFECLI